MVVPYALNSKGELIQIPDFDSNMYTIVHFQRALEIMCVKNNEDDSTGTPTPIDMSIGNDMAKSYQKIKELHLKHHKDDVVIGEIINLKLEHTSRFVLTLLALAVDWDHECTLPNFPRIKLLVSNTEAERIRLFIRAIQPASTADVFSHLNLSQFFNVIRKSAIPLK